MSRNREARQRRKRNPSPQRFYHGGQPGLPAGDRVLPPAQTGAASVVGNTNSLCRPDRVYVTTDFELARFCAAMFPLGDVYEVKPAGVLEPDADFPQAPSFAARSARIQRTVVAGVGFPDGITVHGIVEVMRVVEDSRAFLLRAVMPMLEPPDRHPLGVEVLPDLMAALMAAGCDTAVRGLLDPLLLATLRALYVRDVVPLNGNGSEVGYGMHPMRPDDCFRAAVATATQTPIELVPDPCLDARIKAGEPPLDISRDTWRTVVSWADGRGLRLTFHDDVPLHAHRWIGVCPGGPGELLGDHSLVMSGGRVIFDPAFSVTPPPGLRCRRWRASDVTYGLMFQPRSKEELKNDGAF